VSRFLNNSNGFLLIIISIKIYFDIFNTLESREDEGLLGRYILIWIDVALFWYLITRIAISFIYILRFKEIKILTAIKLAVLFYEIRFFLMAGGIIPQPNLIPMKNLFIYLFT